MSPVVRLLSAVLCLSSVVTAQVREGGEPGQAAEGQAAAQQGPPRKMGRILESATKGKITTLKVETTEGESYEVKVTPLLDFFVVGKGDAGFVRKGVYVNARGVMTNEKIFLNKVTVILLPKGKRAPLGKVQKVLAQEGESVETYEVSGEILDTAPAEDYPDHTAIALKVGGRVPPIWLEPGFQVDVASSDPSHAGTGADVEMAMKVLRGGKLLPMAMRVQREAEFNSAELLGELEKPE